jgi:hypothetical protein
MFKNSCRVAVKIHSHLAAKLSAHEETFVLEKRERRRHFSYRLTSGNKYSLPEQSGHPLPSGHQSTLTASLS